LMHAKLWRTPFEVRKVLEGLINCAGDDEPLSRAMRELLKS
jgi:hypothetical protein